MFRDPTENTLLTLTIMENRFIKFIVKFNEKTLYFGLQ